MMSTSASTSVYRRLLQAARGGGKRSSPLRCFPLESHHIGHDLVAASPQDFHGKLCNMIRNAQHRVYLASLYVGTGTGGRQEQEFLNALHDVSARNNNNKLQIKILLDENRATRRIIKNESDSAVAARSTTTTTSSADAVHECLQQHECSSSSDDNDDNGCGLFLFRTLSEPRRSLLPSPLNEIAGVFHCKVYVVDDELILSGANLSEEYFVDRQDRYMLFTLGGGGLVDFYANLVDILCRYGYRYKDKDNSNQSYKTRRKLELIESLSRLMDGSRDVDPDDDDNNIGSHGDYTSSSNVVAYAVPTFQAPEGFFPTSHLDFPMDAMVTRNVLETALSIDKSSRIQLASAYLNPTPQLTSTLSKFKHLQLLTAGYKSHGFAPKPGQPPRRGDWVPSIFSALYAELEHVLPHAEFLYYERPGWTFHSKGLWVTMTMRSNDEQDDSNLVAAVVGSGNYGARSEVMDVESNTILVFCQKESELQTRLKDEWATMRHYAHEGHAIEFPKTSWKVKAALPFIRDLF